MAQYGTLYSLDLGQAQLTVLEYGEDLLAASIEADMTAHQLQTRDMVSALCDISTDQLRRYGGADYLPLARLDQFGRADAMKVNAGATVGFPLNRNGRSLQWSATWFAEHSPNDMLMQVDALQDGDVRTIQSDIKRALFVPTNFSFVDEFVNWVTLPVKALLNADSAPIPPGPNGEVFDPTTHTHYLATASGTWANSDLDALIKTVVEHYAAGAVKVLINQAQEPSVRGFAGFIAYQPVMVMPSITAPSVNPQVIALNTQQLNNRAIGVYGNFAAEIVIKPWVPANYAFCYLDGAPKPLVLRERRPGSFGLHLVADQELYPLRAQGMENNYGIGVWNRPNGACQQVNATSYTVPANL